MADNSDRMLQSWVNPGAIRQGVIDVEIAPVGTLYDDASGKWEKIGIIEPGSYKLSTEREKYVLERGYPKARVFGAIIGQKGTVAFTLDEVTARAYELANGGIRTDYLKDGETNATVVYTQGSQTTVNNVSTNTNVVVEDVSIFAADDWILYTNTAGDKYPRKVLSVDPATKNITLESVLPAAPVIGEVIAKISVPFESTANQLVVADVSKFNPGDWILHTNAVGSKYLRKVKSVNSDAKVITLESALPAAPVIDDLIAKIKHTRNVIGGTSIQQYSLRAVVVDQHGDEEILYFKTAEPDGKLAPTFDPTKHFQLPLGFDLCGYSVNVNGNTEYVLGEIYVKNKVTA